MGGVDNTDDRVGGRYRLLEVVGTGGMGQVWRAEDDLLLRTVAVKEITVPSTALLVAEAMREARAAARLDHPGVVKIFDVVWRRGRCWIVMEYVESRSLQRVVREGGPLPYREVARIGLAVLAALRTAHAAGVLHRDVKPDNVLLADDGRVVLTDFGLATVSGAEDGPDPRLGSPSFIAPERLESDDAGVASDLWSFGAMLYAAVEGRPPFARGDAATSLRALLEDPPDAPKLAGPLTPIILALLDKDPARRPSAAQIEPRLSAALRPRRRSRLVLASLAVVALVAAVIVVGHDPGQKPQRISPAAMRPAVSATARVPGGTEPLMAVATSPCGAPGNVVAAATTGAPADLAPGWIWFRDPTGFALSLPRGWRRSPEDTDSRGDSGVCFSDPTGHQALTVRSVTTEAAAPYWRKQEAARPLTGYRRIALDAEWEYLWNPAPATIRHERRALIPAVRNRSYLLRWRVADPEWSSTVTIQRGLFDRFRSEA
ncbi:Serine/threonine protein kinase [Actinoplanes cyaneus]|nr:Serine/threonine protein kinase [Actinoplanes cyaneus]